MVKWINRSKERLIFDVLEIFFLIWIVFYCYGIHETLNTIKQLESVKTLESNILIYALYVGNGIVICIIIYVIYWFYREAKYMNSNMKQIAVTWDHEFNKDKSKLILHMILDGNRVAEGVLEWPNIRPCKVREKRTAMVVEYEKGNDVTIIRDF
jgi:hypothetical protein